MYRLFASISIFTAIAVAPWSVFTPARADSAVDAGGSTDALPYLEDTAAEGRHWRFETAKQGPVHVWMPPGYEYKTAGIVVYVHGHIHNADQAWEQHRLAEQFLNSKQNALFIVPEAQINGRDSIKWNSLGRLLREVRRQTKLKRPWGPLVAVGHSGAYRTLLKWLDYTPLDHIILLDALYGHEAPFWNWMHRARGHHANRLTIIAVDTIRWPDPWVRKYGAAETLDYIPERFDDFTPAQRRAKLLYMRSQHDHMPIVREGKVMPLLLRVSRLKLLE